MFTAMLARLLSDRFGRKYAVLFGIFGFSFLTALYGLANSTQQIFAVRFVTAWWRHSISSAPIAIGYLGDHYSVGFGILFVCVPAAFLACAAFASTGLVKPSTVGEKDAK